MKIFTYVTILCWIGLFWSCSGLLVTKNMNRPRVQNINNYKDIGKKLAAFHGVNTQNLPPIVCIPGVGGSQLLANVEKTERSHWYCQKSSSWYLIWLQLYELVPGPPLACWSANIVLNYNTTTGVFSNVTGVDIKANDFGSTEGFEYVDPNAQSESIYFAGLVDTFVNMGYVRGQNLLGAPYDWRLSPNYMPKFFSDLKTMIETAYAVNNTKVAIVAHSMGNLFFLTFLRSVPQSWKDKYILTYIATSPPWVGAAAAVQSLTSGYDFSIPYLLPSLAKVVQRTFASNYFLLPNPLFFKDQVLVSTPTKNYTANDYESLFTDLGVQDYYVPWNLSYNSPDVFQPPGVDVYCLYGYNVSTVQAETYAGTDFSKPTLITGDGDGTVPLDSLTFCQNWVNQTDKKVTVKGYQGQEHVNLLIFPTFIADVVSAIFNNTIPN